VIFTAPIQKNVIIITLIKTNRVIALIKRKIKRNVITIALFERNVKKDTETTLIKKNLVLERNVITTVLIERNPAQCLKIQGPLCHERSENF
jgi:hypothetical protein